MTLTKKQWEKENNKITAGDLELETNDIMLEANKILYNFFKNMLIENKKET